MNLMTEQTAPDLVVISHLRWPWVWQRPQHLVSRLASARAQAGARTFFVEEPLPCDVASPELLVEDAGAVVRIALLIPQNPTGAYLGFADPAGADYPALLAAALPDLGARPRPEAWLYTPMAVPFLAALQPSMVIYDVMDDLAGFDNAPAGLRERQSELLATADLVFTGGRSLHRSTTSMRHSDVHLFASGVETGHFARAIPARQTGAERPKVAGYIGVIDERLDLSLVAGLAGGLDDWIIRMVGPITKIDEHSLPTAANLEYPGMARYDDLPDVMAGFDVALMPFALNDATASISPTKTLEYFAAGLPVVSTRVPDVVADYGDAVLLADDAAEFATACRQALTLPGPASSEQIRAMLHAREWNSIADAMDRLIQERRRARSQDRSNGRAVVPARTLGRSSGLRADLAEAHRLPVATGPGATQDTGSPHREHADLVAVAPVPSTETADSAPGPQASSRGGAEQHLHHAAQEFDSDAATCPTCATPAAGPAARGSRS